VLFLIAALMVAVATHLRIALVTASYTYLASAFIGLAITRFRHRGSHTAAATDTSAQNPDARTEIRG
jgi:hypothetical protein